MIINRPWGSYATAAKLSVPERTITLYATACKDNGFTAMIKEYNATGSAMDSMIKESNALVPERLTMVKKQLAFGCFFKMDGLKMPVRRIVVKGLA